MFLCCALAKFCLMPAAQHNTKYSVGMLTGSFDANTAAGRTDLQFIGSSVAQQYLAADCQALTCPSSYLNMFDISIRSPEGLLSLLLMFRRVVFMYGPTFIAMVSSREFGKCLKVYCVILKVMTCRNDMTWI